ncbi:branched-chain-amino-acid aminotransferase [Striga asiatica]|uniref:Branched-chain-amino-acid aminotransferase n=1 Tax=Striga asiatica TaxID=4170 RepID=A0A5A7RC08_STRAF|nr:branched-chain-amino-acid aminotransferase [Striga asiatica]
MLNVSIDLAMSPILFIFALHISGSGIGSVRGAQSKDSVAENINTPTPKPSPIITPESSPTYGTSNQAILPTSPRIVSHPMDNPKTSSLQLADTLVEVEIQPSNIGSGPTNRRKSTFTRKGRSKMEDKAAVMLIDPSEVGISALLGKGERKWDNELIYQTFEPEDASKILSIPLSEHSGSDKLIWHWSPKCTFSVKEVAALSDGGGINVSCLVESRGSTPILWQEKMEQTCTQAQAVIFAIRWSLKRAQQKKWSGFTCLLDSQAMVDAITRKAELQGIENSVQTEMFDLISARQPLRVGSWLTRIACV